MRRAAKDSPAEAGQSQKERRPSDVRTLPRRSGVVYGAGPRRRQSAADGQQGDPQSENGRDEAGHFHFRKQARLYCPPTAPGGDWIYL
jgi:hypothetical protein